MCQNNNKYFNLEKFFTAETSKNNKRSPQWSQKSLQGYHFIIYIKQLTLCMWQVRKVDNAELPCPMAGEKSQHKNINLFLRAYLRNHTS